MRLKVPASLPRIDYHAMRMLRFRRALRDFLRRWGLYLLIGAALFGAGSDAPLTTTAAAASLLLWPLRAAADHDWMIVPATLAYALVGMLPVVLTRSLWWPDRWVDAERALPLAAPLLHRSDRIFGAWVMLPWQALLLVGWIAIALHEDAVHDRFHRWLAVGGWCVATAGSLWLSMRWMRRVRRPRSHSTGRSPIERARPHVAAVRALGRTKALVALPLLRGAARTSAWLLAVAPLVAIACASLVWWTPLSIGWTLALLALIVLTATSSLRASSVRELRPLWRAVPNLPLVMQDVERARRGVTLVPALIGTVAGVVAASSLPVVRPIAIVLYACALALGCGIESGDTDTMDPTNHAARWILMLATAIACGSEVAPS